MTEDTQVQANPNPPIQPDLAGYPNVEELVKGYRNSGIEAQRQKARADAYEQALAANPRQDINPRGHVSPYDRLTEYGLPTDALREAIAGEIQNAFQPIARGLTARNQVMQQYPDYTKFEADVAAYVGSDPSLQQTYNELFNVNPVAAIEYGILKFGESKRKSEPANGQADNKQERAEARIPSSRSGESRNQAENGVPNRAAEAFRMYQETGDPRARDAFVKARLKGVLSDDFFERNK